MTDNEQTLVVGENTENAIAIVRRQLSIKPEGDLIDRSGFDTGVERIFHALAEDNLSHNTIKREAGEDGFPKPGITVASPKELRALHDRATKLTADLRAEFGLVDGKSQPTRG